MTSPRKVTIIDALPEDEIAQRRDEVIRRMANTPSPTSDNPAAEAGRLYQTAARSIRGGFAVKILARHIAWMLGANSWNRPVWRDRSVPPDGKTFDTPSFDQYLLRPEREGLHLPSLLTVEKLCEADPEHGTQAIALMRREILDYESVIDRDRKVVQAAAPLGPGRGYRSDLAEHVANSHKLSEQSSTSQARLAARLKRDAPEVWSAYMAGEHRSVRAAALEAGIAKPSFTLPGDIDGAARALRRRFRPAECSRLAALLIGEET